MDSVFTSQNPLLIFGLVFLLVFIGAFEAVYNRSKKRFHGMVLPSIQLLLTTVPYYSIQHLCSSMSGRSSRSPIRTLPSSNLGTHKTHSNRRNASRKRNIRSSNRYKSLPYSSRVCPSAIFTDIVPILHRLKYSLHLGQVDGKLGDSYF